MLVGPEELEDLLITNRNVKIWAHKVRSKWVLVNLATEVVTSAAFIFLFRDLLNVVLSVGLAIPAITLAARARTMKYSVFPDEIIFEWGLFGSNKVSVPFSDVTAINLVEYTDSSYSTIFFGTNGEYKIKKVNFDTSEPRPHITFENVLNGPKVMELLNMLWNRSKKKR